MPIVFILNDLKIAMDELEEAAHHLDHLRKMLGVMKNKALETLATQAFGLFDERVKEIERVYETKLTELNELEQHIMGKSLVIDPDRFLRSTVVHSLLTLRYVPSDDVCIGSVIASEASADNLKFVKNYDTNMYELGSLVSLYYKCELEYDPLLVKFIKVSVTDQEGKEVNASNYDLMNGLYMIRFAATVPGIHKIHVVLSKQHVPGSPLSIFVQDGVSTGPKVPVMNSLVLDDTHVRHARLAAGGTDPASTSTIPGLDTPLQALSKGCFISSATSEEHRKHVCLPETGSSKESAGGDRTFLMSLVKFIADPQQRSEPPSFAESVTKAASCKAPAKLKTGAACPEASALKHDNLNIKADISADRTLMPASKCNDLSSKKNTAAAHHCKPAPGFENFNIKKIDSSVVHALTPASKHNYSSAKINMAVAHQQKSVPGHDPINIRTDNSAGCVLTSASEHNDLGIKLDRGVAHQQNLVPGHDQFSDNFASHAVASATKHDRLNVEIGASAAQKCAPIHDSGSFKVNSYTPTPPASSIQASNDLVGKNAALPIMSSVKHDNMDIKRSGTVLVHSDSARLEGCNSLELASESAVLNVRSPSLGSAKQNFRSPAMPPAACGAKRVDDSSRPACVVQPVGSLHARSRSSSLSCETPSEISFHTSSPAGYPGSISARLLLELDSYRKLKFFFPIGITATSEGRIIVCDTGNNRVVTFDAEGRPLHEANLAGSKEKFGRPSAVVAMDDGTYAVKDDVCIYVFSRHGEFIRTLGKGSLSKPYGLALFGTENLLTVSLGEPVPALRRFSTSGSFESSVAYGPLAHGLPVGSKCRFMDMHQGAVFVSDLGLSCVYKTDLEGQLITTFGSKGTGRGHMLEPSGVSGTEDLLFIGDSKNNRIQAFDSDGKFVSVVKMASRIVRPSGLYMSPTDKLYGLHYLRGVAGIYKVNYLDSGY